MEELFQTWPQWAVNQFMSFLGWVVYSLILVLMFENKWNKNKRLTWKKYWQDNRFDFLVLFIVGQITTAIQVFLFSPLAVFFFDDAWDWYYDIEEFISFSLGIFALHMLSRYIGIGRKKIDEL